MKSGFRVSGMADIMCPGSVASLYQVVFRCGAVSGCVVLTVRGWGHILAAVVMKYFSRWVIHKGARRKQNWLRSKNSHRIQLHCKKKNDFLVHRNKNDVRLTCYQFSCDKLDTPFRRSEEFFEPDNAYVALESAKQKCQVVKLRDAKTRLTFGNIRTERFFLIQHRT